MAAFEAKYTIRGTEQAIVAALQRRGLRRSLARDRRCVIQWSPFTRTKWGRMLDKQLLVANHYVHSGLVRKADLFQVLRRVVQGGGASKVVAAAVPEFIVVDGAKGLDAVRDAVRSVLERDASSPASAPTWVLKGSTTNNACAVHFLSVSEPEAAEAALASLGADGAADGKGKAEQQWLLQRHVDKPLLLDLPSTAAATGTSSHKFHLRVNVLALGSLQLFVHEDMVAHVAVEPFSCGGWDRRFVHVTNHCTQKAHAQFNSAVHTIHVRRLAKLLARQQWQQRQLGSEESTAFVEFCRNFESALKDRIRSLVRDIFLAFRDRRFRKQFLPLPNCFEVYGLDLLLTPGDPETDKLRSRDLSVSVQGSSTTAMADGAALPIVVPQLRLLEINSGPGLEGHCAPDVCNKVVDDVLRLAFDPLLKAVTAGMDGTKEKGAEEEEEEAEEKDGRRGAGTHMLKHAMRTLSQEVTAGRSMSRRAEGDGNHFVQVYSGTYKLGSEAPGRSAAAAAAPGAAAGEGDDRHDEDDGPAAAAVMPPVPPTRPGDCEERSRPTYEHEHLDDEGEIWSPELLEHVRGVFEMVLMAKKQDAAASAATE